MSVDIERLAFLARIKLSSFEKEKLQMEFGAILDYVSKLKEVDIGGAEEPGAGFGKTDSVRDDDSPHPPLEFSERLLENAPSKEGGYIKVKKVI